MTSAASPPAARQLTTWVEIDLEAIVHNYRQVKEFVGEPVKVLAVVKANAYGHGLVEVSDALETAGADYLGVTRIEEGVILREAGITTPVLVFCPPLPGQMETALGHQLTTTVDSLGAAEQIAHASRVTDHATPLHVKIDTGMGRLGLDYEEAVELIFRMRRLEGLQVEGLYTHFANALDKNAAPTLKQLERFQSVVDAAGRDLPLCHAANSAALLRFPSAHFRMVRTGTLLYGQYPSPHTGQPLDLWETFTWKARIASVRRIKKGEAVGYGSEWRASRDCAIATLPVGFADGFGVEISPRTETFREAFHQAARQTSVALGLRSSPRHVKIGDTSFAIVGRIGMQQSSIVIPEGEQVNPGDIATIPARRLTVNPLVPRIHLEFQHKKP